jgi:hypothetical protein
MVFDIFVGYFSNPISWVFIGIFLGLGVLIGVFLRPFVGNQVIKFSPDNHTFRDFNIDEETAISIYCDKVKGIPPQRFFKTNPGYTGIVGRFLKKPITRYLGMEGTAYTWELQNGEWIELGTLANAVRTLWGEEFWGTVPENQQELLETSKINVTVELDKSPLTPEGMRSISEEDIQSEEDRKAAETFWQERQHAQRGFYINMLLAGGTGFAVCSALVLLGLIKAPAETVTVVQQTANSTAAMMKTALRMILRI